MLQLLNNNLTHTATAWRDFEDLWDLELSVEVLVGQRDATDSVVPEEASAGPY